MRHWYAVRCKPKKEALATAVLGRAGFEVYLPQAEARHKRGQPPRLEPFFPGYLFVRLNASLGEVRLVRYSPGVLHIIGYGDRPCPVPDDLVSAIQQRLASRQSEARRPAFRSGDRVVIASGPLRDVEAIFDATLPASGRVRVLISILERVCRAVLPADQLRPISQATASQ